MTSPLLIIDTNIIDRMAELNFLGINLNKQFNWKSHIDKISNRFKDDFTKSRKMSSESAIKPDPSVKLGPPTTPSPDDI